MNELRYGGFEWERMPFLKLHEYWIARANGCRLVLEMRSGSVKVWVYADHPEYHTLGEIEIDKKVA